ncbi:hypothetical protein D0Y65_055425 [Glycine soja]|uniref:Uncharacterized protein n=1 Tax=Glycine soja TaxID=3848 RepID=A0A445EXX0_GLYSO|nr:hypothetical protein D0Y65_055425 [Glycine soja]
MARIMVSERKATCFQQELISTKEEALRKLLRLKQMFDSKMAPMHVNHAREVPEYEINPKELDLTNSVEIMKHTLLGGEPEARAQVETVDSGADSGFCRFIVRENTFL